MTNTTSRIRRFLAEEPELFWISVLIVLCVAGIVAICAFIPGDADASCTTVVAPVLSSSGGVSVGVGVACS